MATTKKDGKATGREVEVVKNGNRQTVQGKAPATKKAPVKKSPNTVLKAGGSQIPRGPKGHRGCVAGTRKEQVAICFDKSGRDAAIALAEKLKLAPSTAKSWIGFWIRSDRKTVTKGKGSK